MTQQELDAVRGRRSVSRRLLTELDEWSDPRIRLAVLARVRDRREAVDRLARQQRRDDPDAPTTVRWAAIVQRVRLAASRAELAEWQAILSELR